jgi:hypothetical protein
LDINDPIAGKEFFWEAFEKIAADSSWNHIWLVLDCWVAISIIGGDMAPSQSQHEWAETPL